MEIDVLLTPTEAVGERVEGRAVAVIDVFRATSCICAAMEAGARQLIPLTSIEECLEMRTKMVGVKNILLGGERKTKKIEGFDIDNSPISYSAPSIKGSTIIMSTTNGTRAINAAAAAGAHSIAIASLLNASAVAAYLGSAGRDIVILCAGRLNRFTMEDALCAGYIVSLINESHTCHLSDIAWTLADAADRYSGDFRVPLRNCAHYNQINGNGLADDVSYCLQRDIFTSVPLTANGIITIV